MGPPGGCIKIIWVIQSLNRSVVLVLIHIHVHTHVHVYLVQKYRHRCEHTHRVAHKALIYMWDFKLTHP